MAKLSDLKLTPEEREEREARRRERRGRIAGIVARAEPHRRAEEPSRGDLHALLDACLDLSEMRAPDGWRAAVEGGEDDAVAAARVLGRALAWGAFGWTEPDAPLAEWPGGGRETWPSLERWPVL